MNLLQCVLLAALVATSAGLRGADDVFEAVDSELDELDDLDDTISALKRKLYWEYIRERLSIHYSDERQSEHSDKYSDEKIAAKWLSWYNKKAAIMDNMVANAEFTYSTDITKQNERRAEKAMAKYEEFGAKCTAKAKLFKRDTFSPDIRRQLMLISKSDVSSSKEVNGEKTKILTEMKSIYSTSKVCDASKKCFSLEPGLQEVMSHSRNYEKLLWAWKGWRDAVGPKLRKLYPTFVKLSNISARESGYDDEGDAWRKVYETDNLEGMVTRLWGELEPMYLQLHAYVRKKLSKTYPGKIRLSGPIPAHLLGNMWSQQWDNILPETLPFPGIPTSDFTSELVKQRYTPRRMFETAEEFFTSIGLSKMADEFWQKSMIKKPSNKKVVCHGSAEDFHNASDYRIKMCTKPTSEYFVTIHHEMGHVEYYMQYAKQPNVFRNGANPGFHEAVGDTIALSVMTPEHLVKKGLLKPNNNMDKTLRHQKDMNFLFSQALQKVAFLPFGLLIDKWRWNVFSGNTTPESYNSDWWKLRTEYQGIEAPVPRSEADFDPGAKFHVPDNTPYVRYFLSFIMQFQFHKTLCDIKGHKGPLHHCDIYESKEAGAKLKSMLSLGNSKPWPDILEVLTGERKVSTEPIKTYFEPLMKWLTKQNKGQHIGWSK